MGKTLCTAALHIAVLIHLLAHQLVRGSLNRYTKLWSYNQSVSIFHAETSWAYRIDNIAHLTTRINESVVAKANIELPSKMEEYESIQVLG